MSVVQVLEYASTDIATVDMTRRLGGTTALSAQRPGEEDDQDDGNDCFGRLARISGEIPERTATKAGKTGGDRRESPASAVAHGGESSR